MSEDTIESVLQDSVRGLALCYQAKLINSALILLYCGIDTASSLDKMFDGQSVRKRYTGWCDAFLLSQTSFDFTSLELYAARCGVIHENSAQSDLSIRGEARRIIYAWGDSKVDTLREMIDLAHMKGYVAVQFEELMEAYGKGLDAFAKSLRDSEERRLFAIRKMNFCLRNQAREETQSLLEWGKSQLRRD